MSEEKTYGMPIHKLQALIKEYMVIDGMALDDAALSTPQLHGELMNLYVAESILLKKGLNTLKALELERWKYYNGKQSDEYYKKYGFSNEKILKSDIDKYMNGDSMMHQAIEFVETLKLKVKMLEEALKQMSNRSFQIRDAIEWRKFQAGG